MIAAPRWSDEQLTVSLERSKALFRQERMQEPLEAYLEAFELYQGSMQELLEASDDLKLLDKKLPDVLSDAAQLRAFRYLSGPPVSADDLKVLAEAVLSRAGVSRNPEMAERILSVIRSGLDRRRFPWVAEGRAPTEAERDAAVLASAALLAASHVSTSRRSEGKGAQELRVEDALLARGFRKVATRKVEAFDDFPSSGEFCRESLLGARKADFILGSPDRRVVAIECKVSNSSTNSVKRLNNDAAAKAEAWTAEFGTRVVVPVAVLSGVYKLHNLVNAQERGLTLFWAHDLDAFMDWLGRIGSS